MAPTRRTLTLFGLLVFGVLAMSVGAQTASGTERAPLLVKPVIGQPVTVPARPVAGRPFSASFHVTRSDTGEALKSGTMICDPSVAGTVIRHAESFKGGTARLAFVVPKNAAGKLLKVKVTIKAAGQSATRVSTFRILSAVANVPVVVSPSVSIDDVSAVEGNSGTTMMSFPVTLSAASTKSVSVNYLTSNGTATAPADYAAAGGTIRFAPGETSKTIQVAVVGDTTYEPTETFTVALSNPVNATIAVASATGTVENDDPLVRPGHYSGLNSMATLFAFDVTPDGTSVTHIVTGQINQSCNGGMNLYQGNLNYGDYWVRIDSQGSFTSDETFKGKLSDGETTVDTSVHVVITGHFAGEAASGTLLYTTGFTWQGTSYSCTAGNQTWTATRTG